MPVRSVVPLLGLLAGLGLAACTGGDGPAAGPAEDVADASTGDFVWNPPDAPGGTDLVTDQASVDTRAPETMDGTGVDADAAEVVPVGCTKDSDCEGAEIPLGSCQRPVCNRHLGLCVPGPAAPGEACEDGDLCTTAERCDDLGICAGVPVVCDDGNLCTTDLCDPDLGCIYEYNQNNCDDGNGCTTQDKCMEGSCAGTPTDACACALDADCGGFDDGDLCNGQVRCLFGQCKVSTLTVVQCDTTDDTSCVRARCTPETGLCAPQVLGDGRPCDDGDLCTIGDICLQGLCTPSAPQACDDGNPCTVDTCDATKGCLHEFSPGWPCQDGEDCTVGDYCAAGTCVPGGGNACLTHTCYADWPLFCGASDAWTTGGAGSTTNIDAWACGDLALPGPEYTYVFTPMTDGTAVLLVSGDPVELRTLVLESSGQGCEAVNCRHTVDGTLSFDAFAGATYYVVVDSTSPEGAPYGISLGCTPWEETACHDGVDNDLDDAADCLDADCQGTPDCPAAICLPVWSLQCNTSDVGTNYGQGATAGLVTYRDIAENQGCLDNSWEYTGPEFTYRFDAPTDMSVTVRLLDESAQTDLMVLEDGGAGCVPGGCIAWGLKKVTFPAKEGHTYYFVVDGYAGAKGSFGIELNCPLVQETACDDGKDNDLDGEPDCLDVDCGGAPFCQKVCVPSREAWCGFAEGFSNLGWGSTHNVVKYPQCNSYSYSGPEVTYRFIAPYDTTLHVTLALETASTDILILPEGCDPSACLAAGMDTLAFPVEEGEVYSVVVDGYNAAVGTYLIQFDCVAGEEVLCADGADNDGDGLLDCADLEDCATDPACPKCSPKDVLTCGESDTWDTADADATDVVSGYSCSPGRYDGPEYAYEFTAGASGPVTVSLTGESAPTDVLVLEDDGCGCSPVQCIAWGPSEASFNAVKARTYFIVVDGHGKAPAGSPPSFAAGSYTVTLSCEE